MDDARPVQARSVRFVHNTVLSFLGLVVPLAVAFALMPVVAHNLGPARFGLLALAWAVLEYLVVFDLGLGKATTRFVAESAGQGGDVSQTVSISVATQIATGAVAGFAFALAAPLLARHIFEVDPRLQGEAAAMFRVVGYSLPAVMLLGTMRGVLEGAQRFDLSAATRIPSSAAAIVIPAIGSAMGASLAAMLWWVLAARVLTCVVLAVLIGRYVPAFEWQWPSQWRRLARLILFGGWVAVSSVVSPLLIYLDRFLLGAIVGLAAVGYYTGPYEGVTRLLLIPVSLIGPLLPAMTQAGARGATAESARLLAGSTRYLFLALAPPLALIVVFAPEILAAWMGAEYAEQSSLALRFLAIGVMINALAHPPYIALYAEGRPDLPAKFHLIELAVHVPLAWMLVSRFGVTGAALSWALRVLLDTTLLFWGARRVMGTRFSDAWNRDLPLLLSLLGLLLGGCAAAVAISAANPVAALFVALASLAAFLRVGWQRLMTPDEKDTIRRTALWYGTRLRPN